MVTRQKYEKGLDPYNGCISGRCIIPVLAVFAANVK